MVHSIRSELRHNISPNLKPEMRYVCEGLLGYLPCKVFVVAGKFRPPERNFTCHFLQIFEEGIQLNVAVRP